MQGPETRLRKRIVLSLKEAWPSGYFRKIHGNQFQNIGMADLLCCVDGKFIALEIKIPEKRDRVTEAQIYEGNCVKRAGGHFAVVTSKEEAIEAVQEALSDRRNRRISAKTRAD